MRKTILAVLLLLTTSALAETAGRLFPLANTRYGSTQSYSILRSNGTDAFLFSRSNGVVTVTRLVEGQNRAGELLFESGFDIDAVWTGTHFLVTAEGYDDSGWILRGHLVDRNGHPMGGPFVLQSDAQDPRLAAGHGAVLLVCRNFEREPRAVLLTPDGRTLSTTTLGAVTSSVGVTATPSGFVALTSTATSTDAPRLDAQGRFIARQPVAGPYAWHVAATTRGSQSLLVWCPSHRIEAALLRDDGTLGATLTLDSGSEADPLNPQIPTAAWNGTGWTVAYDGYSPEGPRVNVVQLDAGAGRILSHEKTAPRAEGSSLATIGSRLYAAWTPNNTTTVVSTLPLSGGTPRPGTFGAAWQDLRLAAASASAMLVIWSETVDGRGTIRAGTRTRDGQWSEHELGFDPGYRSLLAGDSRRFVFFRTTNDEKAEAVFLDEEGRPAGVGTALPFTPEAVAWNGRHYALLGAENRMVLLAPDGTLSTPVTLNLSFTAVQLVSNGDGFLAAGGKLWCNEISCDTMSVRAVRLTAALQPAGGEIAIQDDYSSLAKVVWNGSHYVVLWADENGSAFTRIAPATDTATTTRQKPGTYGLYTTVAAGDGRLVTIQTLAGQRYATFTSADGTALDTVAIDDDERDPYVFPMLLPLGDGSVAYLTDALQRNAPHYGARRLSMSILSGPAIAPPAAPRVTVRDDGARFLVSWEAPAGTINGYRLEHRIDDGVWIELERWFGAGEQSVSVRRPSFGSTFAFRVRAFNDAGASGYSSAAEPAVPKKRRAVR
jgi:hypothetical protein